MEGLLCLELPLPGTTASRRTIPRSPLSPPLTRGPNQPANVPAAAGSGEMRASRPTVARVVAAAPVGRASALVRRGGPWPSRGTLRRRRVSGTMQASSPTKVYYNPEVAIPRLAAGPPWFVGEGFIPPANVPAAAGSGGMRASRPTVARVIEAAPVGRASAMVRRGGPWPSRGTLRQCGVSGTMQASSPTLVCGIAGFVVSRLAAAFASLVKGRWHGRRP